MSNQAQLERCVSELAAAIKKLASLERDVELQQDVADQYAFDSEGSDSDIHQGERREILSCLDQMRKLVHRPSDILWHLEYQIELLACLHWLAEFQIPACIPPMESVPIQDLANLAQVPEDQLRKVIRLTSTAGYLTEPQLGSVAHTALSAPSSANRSWLDAITFLAEYAAPAARLMAQATQSGSKVPHAEDYRQAQPANPDNGASVGSADTRESRVSAWGLATGTSTPFLLAVIQQPELSRQWAAYRRQGAASRFVTEEIVDSFQQLNWLTLRNACIVEVGAQTTSMARRLVDRYPTVRVIVQMPLPVNGGLPFDSTIPSSAPWEDGGDWQSFSSIMANRINGGGDGSGGGSSARITTMHRSAGARQTVREAGVYILTTSSSSILADLQEHVGILRASDAVMLIQTMNILPEPGSVRDFDTEVSARTRDLTRFHLTACGEMEMSELLEAIEMVYDDQGRLVVVNKLRARNNAVIALVVKYQAFGA